MSVVVIVVSVGVALFLFECIWIYSMAKKQEKNHIESEINYRRIIDLFDSIISSPGDSESRKKAAQLKKHLGDSVENFDIFCEKFFDQLNKTNPEDERKQRVLFDLLDVVDPMGFYSKLLRSGSKYKRAHACRKLADFEVGDEIKNIERFLSSKDSELSYNAAMALSQLGVEQGVSKYVVGCRENYQFSHRVLLQLFGEYNEDIKSLASLIFKECDDYIKATVIKSIAKYRFADFEYIYLSALRSKNTTMRVAGLAALGALKNEKYEQEIIRAANDKMWIVRNAAVKALGDIGTPGAVETIVRAISDIEWWVRYNAARTLVNMENGLEHIERILQGYDTYASDAMKYTLYRQE